MAPASVSPVSVAVQPVMRAFSPSSSSAKLIRATPPPRFASQPEITVSRTDTGPFVWPLTDRPPPRLLALQFSMRPPVIRTVHPDVKMPPPDMAEQPLMTPPDMVTEPALA